MVEKQDIRDVGPGRRENKFLKRKDNTLKSLREVEFFLGNWKRVLKGIKLYKILK